MGLSKAQTRIPWREIITYLEVKVGNKVIIRTGKISPDQYIENIELVGSPLKKGKHKGIAVVKAYNRKTDELIGQVNIDMEITSK